VPKECKQYEYNHIYIPAQKYVPRYRRFLDVLRTVAPGGSTEFKIIAMWTSDLQCPLQKMNFDQSSRRVSGMAYKMATRCQW